MAEWTIATVCKTVARKGSAGSNPAPSTEFITSLLVKNSVWIWSDSLGSPSERSEELAKADPAPSTLHIRSG